MNTHLIHELFRVISDKRRNILKDDLGSAESSQHEEILSSHHEQTVEWMRSCAESRYALEVFLESSEDRVILPRIAQLQQWREAGYPDLGFQRENLES